MLSDKIVAIVFLKGRIGFKLDKISWYSELDIFRGFLINLSRIKTVVSFSILEGSVLFFSVDQDSPQVVWSEVSSILLCPIIASSTIFSISISLSCMFLLFISDSEICRGLILWIYSNFSFLLKLFSESIAGIA
ncbi:hypothetical protein [Mycoplasmopsis cynos]|uniref:hypothetical protein n=1 Tax=Mycoplasmopsis cynos TaxID=171284 RepID=UPI00031CD80D|nr:hypothetical protein [Mycoplasmopsis cynos]